MGDRLAWLRELREAKAERLEAEARATKRRRATEIHATKSDATEIPAGDATEIRRRGRPTSGGMSSTERSRLHRERLRVARAALDGK